MRKSEARIRAEALALSAMIASMNVMPALADTTIPEIGIESIKEGEEGDKDKDLASPSNATPVEDDTEDDEDFEFEEELENDLETEESTENEEDTESSESEKESLGDTENESTEDTNEIEESTEDIESEKESLEDTENENKEDTNETEETESELETEEGTNESLEEEVDLEQIQVATPSNLEKPELKPELMTLREVVYGEWNDSEDGNWQILPSEDGTCSIKPLSNEMKTGDVVVPEEIDGFTVTSIADGAWYGCLGLTELNISGLEAIGSAAFAYSSVTKVNIDNVGEIGNRAFEYCYYIKEVNLNNIERVGSSVFAFSDGIETISLTSIGEIGNRAFDMIIYIRSLTLDEIGTIRSEAFFGLKITTLNLGNIGTIEAHMFNSNNSSYYKQIESLNIRKVDTLKEDAFSYFSGLKNITIDEAGTIEANAFNKCNNLSELSIGKVETIKNNAFSGKANLQNITIGEAGTIESNAFNSCSSLETLKIDKVDTISDNTFSNKKTLQSVTIGEAGTIGSSAFQSCKALTDLNLGTIGTIGKSAFNSCTALTEIEIESADLIKLYAFYNCGALNSISIKNAGTIEESAVLAKENIHIGHAENIKGIIAKEITIDSAGKVYAGNTSCRNMGSSVGDDICERITIGKADDVKVFAKDEVYVGEANNIDKIGSGTTITTDDGFATDSKVNKITVDKADKIHKISAIELDLGEIGEFTYSQALDGDLVNAYFRDDSTIEIVNIDSVSRIPDNCFKFCSNLKNITIGHTDYIGDEAFKDCTVLESISASVDNNIDAIGRAAFMNCQNLKKAEFNNVGTIREYAFQDLQALNTLKINDVNSIEKKAFHNCPSLGELTLGEVGTIGEEAFTLCDSLRTIKAGNIGTVGKAAFKELKSLNSLTSGSIQNIGDHAFMKCKVLETVDIGEVYNMDECAFAFCENLSTLNWVNKLKILPNFAFYKCGKLTSFDLGEVESIGVQALFKCNGIKELTVPAGVESVYLVDLPGEYDYSGKADFNRGYKLTFLGDTDFQHYRNGSAWWCGWLNNKYDTENGYVPEIDWRDSIIINEFVLPSKDCKAYKRITNKNNTDIVPKVEGDSEKVLYHAVNDTLRSSYINDFTSEETTEYHWSSYRTLPDVDENDSQHTIIDRVNINGEIIDSPEDNKEQVTVTFYRNDGTEDIHKREEIEKNTIPSFTDIPTRENFKFIGWYKDPEGTQPVNENEPVGEDTNYYAKWEEESNDESIVVTFWMNDGTDAIWSTGGANKGSNPDLSPVPERNGYEFLGWYMEPECINKAREDLVMNQDTDFYAKWEEKDTENDKKEKINIIYWMNDGTDGAYLVMMDQDKGTSLNLRITPPTREGYEFTGWYQEPECENRAKQGITLESDTNVYAGWKLKDTGSGSGGGGGSETPDVKEKVTITYYMNDDTEDIFKTEQIEKGGSPDMNVEPTRKNYKFTGWYYESECENKVPDNITIEEDINVFAGWEKKDTGGNGGSGGEIPDNPDDKKEPIKVTYYENDGTPDIYKTEKIEKGDTPDTSGKPDREGYEFIGWYEDPDCKIPVDPSKPLDEDTEYYAGWKKKDTDPSGNGGGSDKPNDDKKPEDKPNEDNKDEDNKPEDKVEKVKVTYHTNDDTDKIYKEEEIEKGGTPDTEGNPDRDKYEFTGWYLDPECKIPVDPSKPLDEDTDLYAGWKKKDTIPTGNGGSGSHGGGHGGSSSTVTVVNVHEDKPEPDRTTIDENGVPKDKEERENVDTTRLDENGVPKDKAEKDSLPKTGDSRNIFMYMIAFISSLSSMMFMGMRDKMKKISTKKKD